MTGLRVAFADQSLMVGWSDKATERHVRWLFGDVAISDTSGVPDVSLEPRGEQFAVCTSAETLIAPVDLREALECLQAHVLRAICERCTTRLVLHAAALQFGSERIALFVGRSGAGKSTLSAFMLAQGARYITDEAVAFDEGTQYVTGYARPVQLKADVVALTRPLVRDEALWLESVDGAMGRPGAFGASVIMSPVKPDLIVFPEYVHGAECRVAPVSQAETTERLLPQTANATNLPRFGIGFAANLARSIPAFSATYSNTEELQRALKLF